MRQVAKSLGYELVEDGTVCKIHINRPPDRPGDLMPTCGDVNAMIAMDVADSYNGQGLLIELQKACKMKAVGSAAKLEKLRLITKMAEEWEWKRYQT